MKQVQRGFTLIELVMVIVILGILAAVALPKFVDLRADAENGARQAVAGSINSACAMDYAKYKMTNGTLTLTSLTLALAQVDITGGTSSNLKDESKFTWTGGSDAGPCSVIVKP